MNADYGSQVSNLPQNYFTIRPEGDWGIVTDRLHSRASNPLGIGNLPIYSQVIHRAIALNLKQLFAGFIIASRPVPNDATEQS